MLHLPTAKRFAFLALLLVITLACGALIFPAPPSATSTLAPFQPLSVPSATLAEDTPVPTATVIPPTPLTIGMEMRDVIYCTPDGLPLRMDILYPFTGLPPWPVVIHIHGGAWIGGSKIDPADDSDVSALRQAGYMTVAVSYRLAPKYPFPDMIEDIKCAVRYLRAHADEYELDPNHIGAVGSSAGGHLVSLLGLTDKSAGWDVGPYLDQSSRLQAVVDKYGPTDLAAPDFNGLVRAGIIALFGANGLTDKLLASASPLTYVTPDDPPFLILHGDKDDFVNLRQSQKLYDALVEAGVPAELVVVQGAGHGFKPVGGDSTVPTRAQITDLMIAFFDQYLKP